MEAFFIYHNNDNKGETPWRAKKVLMGKSQKTCYFLLLIKRKTPYVIDYAFLLSCRRVCVPNVVLYTSNSALSPPALSLSLFPHVFSILLGKA